MIKNGHRSSHKVPVIRVRFSGNLYFLGRFSKDTLVRNFLKIRPVGVELFHAEGQTNIHEAIRPFSQFCESTNKKKACECITKHLFPLQLFPSSPIIHLTNFCNRNPALVLQALQTGQPIRLLLLLQQPNAQK